MGYKSNTHFSQPLHFITPSIIREQLGPARETQGVVSVRIWSASYACDSCVPAAFVCCVFSYYTVRIYDELKSFVFAICMKTVTFY
jgi:hypothetical protein